MNTKKVGILILSAVVAGVVVSGTSANMFNFDGDVNGKMEMRNNIERKKGSFGRMGEKHFRKGVNGNMKGLTDDEKMELEGMTDEEKKEFFEGKRAERQTEMEERKINMENHKTVIDKLINGEELTDDEKNILEEIKEKRAERQVLVEERQGKNEEFRVIMDKVIAGEDITDEEKVVIDNHKENNNRGMGRGKRGGGRGMHR